MAYEMTDGTIFPTIEEARAYSRQSGYGWHEVDEAPPAPDTQSEYYEKGAAESPFIPTGQMDQFLYSQLQEQTAAAIRQFEEDKSRRVGELTQDYNRYVALTKEDRAINIEETNKAYARAKERAVGGYSQRGIYYSGVKEEGITEVRGEQKETVTGFERAAERSLAEQKIQYGRAKSEIEREYRRAIQQQKRQLGGVSQQTLTAYA